MTDKADYDKSATPSAHKTSHQKSGTDEISVADLAGELTAEQKSSWSKVSGKPTTFTPEAHSGALHTGTATNDNAAAGIIGEWIESFVSLSLTTATMNITSIALTAGDWDLSACVNYNGSKANSRLTLGISLVSATFEGSYGKEKNMNLVSSTSSFGSAEIPRLRKSLAAAATVYLVGSLDVNADSVTAYFTARRSR